MGWGGDLEFSPLPQDDNNNCHKKKKILEYSYNYRMIL